MNLSEKMQNGYKLIENPSRSIDLMASMNRDKTRIVFSGGKFGEHSIGADSSSERIQAHWEGYISNNTRIA